MKTAVILFNLGGPLNLQGINAFLQNLFSDPAILALPDPLRQWVARYIAWKRGPKVQKILSYLGGKSPLLENTRHQATSLEAALGNQYAVFVVMRHAPPFIQEVIPSLSEYDPCEIILLPLYPQFSSTTTGSALRQWFELVTQPLHLERMTKTICCYPTLPGFVQAYADLILKELPHFQHINRGPPRLLFSAHGLPEKVVKAGDPYVQHVVESASAIVKALPQDIIGDWRICYQSRVGFLPWTKPDLGTEIRQAAEDKKSILVVPLSFVSEHSETLVELDITYKEFAHQAGILDYRRVPTVSCHPLFIQGLTDLIKGSVKKVRCKDAHGKCWREA